MIWFVAIVTLFLIRDYILFFGIPKEAKHTTFDWKTFWNDARKNSTKISKLDAILIMNREIFFPFFLIISILLLLVRQLDLFSSVEMLDAHTWIEFFFFSSFALTAFGTIFRISLADTYYVKKIHSSRMRLLVCAMIVIALATTIMVFIESSTMGFLSIPISIIS